MPLHTVYYDAKPLIPWRVRMEVRRAYAKYLRRHARDRWPILRSAGRKPEGWTGWPEGKQFAFVLTHDVESAKGVARCRQLAAVEQEFGFVSSFNFIPRGDYADPQDLRTWLVQNGFEVGVHDLYHDGKLYRDYHTFQENAKLINRYLADWNAVGFRSGFMHHNLGWIHHLDVSYDCSTFDTDPFEPQPDEAHTIFPFWVSPQASVARKGYAELPYTLPQDSTLFLLFQEEDIEIWKQKTQWVVQHGGMVMLNLHPDYVCFDNGYRKGREFPIARYREFLSHIRTEYRDAFWHALPRDVAEFTEEHRFPRPRPARRICMVTHSDYLADARVTRYAEALAERGDHVDVLALKRSPESPNVQQVGGVTLHCLSKRFAKKEKSHVHYLWPMLRFLAVSAAWIAREHTRRPYDLLHIHNIPDFMVFSALFPKLFGAKVILDIHDIVPEFYASKFQKSEAALGIKLLKIAEKMSAKVADHVIIANDLWLEKYARRTGKDGACSVFINNVDTNIFAPRPRTRKDGKLIVIFPGGLQWHQGLDIAIRAFAKVLSASGVSDRTQVPAPSNPTQVSGSSSQRSTLPARSEPSTLNPQLSANLEFHIYGDGNVKPHLVQLAAELGLSEKVKFFNPLPVREVAAKMAEADLGVVPKRADSFGNEAYSTKIMEFMSLGVPVVASSTKIDRFYFNDSVLRFFPSGDADALAQAMIDVLTNDSVRDKLRNNALEYATTNSWQVRKCAYLDLIESLTGSLHTSVDTPRVRKAESEPTMV